MKKTSPSDADRERMTCMEIWGGNRAVDKSFAAPGLDIYVHSQPFQGAKAGGDIYYLTSCASGRISRFLLADVSGHGDQAADFAKDLRDLLRKNVNIISQQNFVSAMNQKITSLGVQSNFATAVAATFFEPTRTLDFSVAGHPYPLYFRAKNRRWVYLDPASAVDSSLNNPDFENMPLGVVDDSEYPGRKVKTEPGDMFLLYSDAFIESLKDNVNQVSLGIQGVVDLLNTSESDPSEVIPFLRKNVAALADGNLDDDDATLILGRFTNTKVRMRDNLLAPFRLVRDAKDRTEYIEQES